MTTLIDNPWTSHPAFVLFEGMEGEPVAIVPSKVLALSPSGTGRTVRVHLGTAIDLFITAPEGVGMDSPVLTVALALAAADRA